MIRDRERAQNTFIVSVVRMNCCDDKVRVKVSSGKDKSGNFCSQGEEK